MKVTQKVSVLVGDYPYADKVKENVLSSLQNSTPIPQDNTNVKAFHTDWDWEPDNIAFRNLKAFVREAIEGYYQPGVLSDGPRHYLKWGCFWANVYKKGDYARIHNHRPNAYSFAYFVKAKWYHPSFVFSDHGERVRPKEGRFVAFPAHLNHHVPKNRFNDTRITLSGNLYINDLYVPRGTT